MNLWSGRIVARRGSSQSPPVRVAPVSYSFLIQPKWRRRISHGAPWLLLAPIYLRYEFMFLRLNGWVNVDDPDMYRGIAEWFVDGYGFARPDTGHPTAYRPPLYPLLLTLCPLSTRDDRILAMLHFVLGLATLGLVWLAAAHLLKSAKCSGSLYDAVHTDVSSAFLSLPTILAVMLTAIDPLLINSSSLVMSETLVAFLVSLLLWCVAREVTTRWRAVLLGIVFGLCCLCRPTFWAFGGLVALVWIVRQFLTRHTTTTPPPLPFGERVGVRGAASVSESDSKASASADHPSPPAPLPKGERGDICAQTASVAHGQCPNEFLSRRLALCICLGTLVTVAPWAIRNLVVFGRPIVTTTHGGYTLLLGHNPVYYREVVEQPWGAVWPGESLTAWQRSLETAIRADGVPPFDEVARDRWMYQQAWGNIAHDPGMAVRAGLTLLGRFWNVVPMSTEGRSLPSVMWWGIGAFYTAVFVAGCRGVWRLTRDEWSRWWPLVALIVSFTCVHSLYWADMRMRAPLVPAIALLAARGLRGSWIVDRAEGRKGDDA